MSEEIYVQFWVYLAYFFSFIFFIIGYGNNIQSYIYYGLFFFIMGIGMVISYKLNIVIAILKKENMEETFYEDSD